MRKLVRRHRRASVRDEALVDTSNYMMIDTLFSLAEAYLFMQLVEVKVRSFLESQTITISLSSSAIAPDGMPAARLNE